MWRVIPLALAAPLQLVRPSADYRQLGITTEGLEFLRSIPGPVAVVAAVGAIHTGKSFLLNQLCESPQGFSVGYTVRPETHGIWALQYPHTVVSTFAKARRFGVVPPAQNTTVIFFDTEGLFSKDASSSYDARLFAITTLMSSEVIYNTVKFIDTHHMEALETLIRRTNLFGLRAYAAHGVATGVSNLSEFLRLLVPTHLSWVVQNFVQDLEDREPEVWLQQLLAQERDAPDAQVNNFFKSIDCVTLPNPAASNEVLQKLDTVPNEALDPVYRASIKRFRLRLLKRAAQNPKLKSGATAVAEGTPMTGKDLADLLVFLVDASNAASHGDTSDDQSPFPELPSVAEQFTKLQLRLMKSDILTIVERDLRQISLHHIQQNAPLGSEAFERELGRQSQQAAKLWNATITGVVHHRSLSGPVVEAEQDFLVSLEAAKEQLRQQNAEMVRDWCFAFINTLLTEHRETVKARVGNDPQPYAELAAIIANAEQPIRQRYRHVFQNGVPELCDTNERLFEQALQEVRKQLEAENEVVLKRTIDEVNRAAVKRFAECARENLTNLGMTPYAELRETLGQCRKHALDDLELHVARYPGVSAIQMRRSEANNEIDAQIQHIMNKWAALCHEKAERFINIAQGNLQLEVRRNVPFPADDEELSEAVNRSAAEWRARYRKEVICSDTEYGRSQDVALELLIQDAKKSIESANVQALKEIHNHAFRNLQSRLEARLGDYYWWPTLSAEAEREALTTLRTAWQDLNSDGTEADSTGEKRRRGFTDKLMIRTARTFVRDDMRNAHCQLNLALITRLFPIGVGFGILAGAYARWSLISIAYAVLSAAAVSSAGFDFHITIAQKAAALAPDSAGLALIYGAILAAVAGVTAYKIIVRPPTPKPFCQTDECGYYATDARTRGYDNVLHATPNRVTCMPRFSVPN